MRRHYTNYFKGYQNIKNYRIKLVTRNSMDEIYETLHEIEKNIH